MPEAVIVATGRTPIGRAFKGSLVDCRPDDLTALVVKTVLAKEASGYVTTYLEEIGERSRLEGLLRAVTRVSPKTMAAYAGLIQLAESRGDLTGLEAILKEASERDPDNIVYKNDYAYLQLMEGQNTAAALTTAEKLTKDHPENIGFRVTFALAMLVAGDTEGAFSVLNTQPVDWSRLTPGQQAVVAGKGNLSQARDLAKSIQRARLKAPELALLKKWLKE